MLWSWSWGLASALRTWVGCGQVCDFLHQNSTCSCIFPILLFLPVSWMGSQQSLLCCSAIISSKTVPSLMGVVEGSQKPSVFCQPPLCWVDGFQTKLEYSRSL